MRREGFSAYLASYEILYLLRRAHRRYRCDSARPRFRFSDLTRYMGIRGIGPHLPSRAQFCNKLPKLSQLKKRRRLAVCALMAHGGLSVNPPIANAQTSVSLPDWEILSTDL